MGRSWRAYKMRRPNGLYWLLQAGTGQERTSVPLGYVTEREAERGRTTMELEEARGTVARVLALDRETRVNYLIFGDDRVERELGVPTRNWARTSLRAYHDEVYAPWRAEHRPASWPNERGYWRRILGVLGNVKLGDLNPRVVADYLDDLVATRGNRQGRPASGATKRLHRSALQALLLRAERLGHIHERPDLARFRIEGSTKRVWVPVDPLSLDELVGLMNASSPKHRAMWAVAGGQGLRPSELIRMQWGDVDWHAKVFTVRGEKTAASADTVAFTPLALRELRTWWHRRGRPVDGVVFPASNHGTPYADSTGFKRALATAARRAGIDRNVTPYLFRHSFATIAWSVGIELDVARRIMRHTDEKMLQTVYCRPRPADLVARAAAFDV